MTNHLSATAALVVIIGAVFAVLSHYLDVTNRIKDLEATTADLRKARSLSIEGDQGRMNLEERVLDLEREIKILNKEIAQASIATETIRTISSAEENSDISDSMRSGSAGRNSSARYATEILHGIEMRLIGCYIRELNVDCELVFKNIGDDDRHLSFRANEQTAVNANGEYISSTALSSRNETAIGNQKLHNQASEGIASRFTVTFPSKPFADQNIQLLQIEMIGSGGNLEWQDVTIFPM